MDEKTLALLGLTQEELQNRVVHQIAYAAMQGWVDYPGGEEGEQTRLGRELSTHAKKAIDAAVERIAAEAVVPKIDEMVSNLVLKQTDRWGHPTGDPISLEEYLATRGEEWLTAKVNYSGATPSYNDNHQQARLVFLVHQQLESAVTRTVKILFADANKRLTDGLNEVVKNHLDQLIKNMTVRVGGI
jgi:hypothetical protein